MQTERYLQFFYTVPACSLAAVAEQTDQVLVPDAPDRLNLLPEIFLCLAPDETYKEIVMLFIGEVNW